MTAAKATSPKQKTNWFQQWSDIIMNLKFGGN